MNELETLLKNQIWDLSGYTTRYALDLAMKTNIGPESQALWEKYCPWSNANGGYINWIKNERTN
jgi:hypothetical protein